MNNPGMSGSTPNQDVFDLRRIRRFVELMKEHDLSEIDIREGTVRIRLRRGANEPIVTMAAPRAAAAPAPAVSAGGTRQGGRIACRRDNQPDRRHFLLVGKS